MNEEQNLLEPKYGGPLTLHYYWSFIILVVMTLIAYNIQYLRAK